MAYSAGLLVVSLMVGASAQAPAQDQLSPKSTQTIDQAVEAWQNGQLAETLRLLSALFEQATPKELELATQRVEQLHGVDMSLEEIITRSRVELVLDGQGGKLGKPGAAELPAAFIALDARMNELLEPARREAEVGMPAIVPDDVLVEKIAMLEPLLSQINQASLLLAHINQLRPLARSANRGELPEAAQAIVARKHADDQRVLDQLREKLTVRVVEFSLVLLNNSLATIVNENASFMRRFDATLRAGDSLAVLHAYWDLYKRAKQKSGGLDATIEARWKAQEEQVRQRAGPVAAKVYHLNEGIRWWLRGRFGQGPLAGGLAKVAPAAATNDRTVQALVNSPLLMPRNIRKPQNPQTVPAPFPVARRHLEWWRLETRVALATPAREAAFLTRPSEGISSTALANGADARPPSRLTLQILETRPEAIRLAQLVGFVEYGRALTHFEALVAACSPAELRAIEDLIGQDERLVVHSNLSSKYDRLDPASTLRLTNPPADPRATSPNERRGLSWMMALARVEFGAMRAGHTRDSASPVRQLASAGTIGNSTALPSGASPFALFPPTKFEREAFLELLFDGLRQHYYEQRTEHQMRLNLIAPTVVVHRNRPQRVPFLQVERKLSVAIEMLEAFRGYAGGSLSPAQHAELNQWEALLTNQFAMINAALNPVPVVVTPQPPQFRPDGRIPATPKVNSQAGPNEPAKADKQDRR